MICKLLVIAIYKNLKINTFFITMKTRSNCENKMKIKPRAIARRQRARKRAADAPPFPSVSEADERATVSDFGGRGDEASAPIGAAKPNSDQDIRFLYDNSKQSHANRARDCNSEDGP